jgi:hypothetical protein
MAIKADKLCCFHNNQQHGMVASLDPASASSHPSATIPVVKPGQAAKGGRSAGQRGEGPAAVVCR